MTRIAATATLLLLVPPAAPARAQAGSDIYHAELRVESGQPLVGAPVNLTRRAGYDNQPAFTPDGRALLFTRIDAAGQADIYRIALGDTAAASPAGVAAAASPAAAAARAGASTAAAGTIDRVTSTAPESEYSPTPLGAGERFSVVRVEADSTQRLWSFDAAGGDPRVILRDVMPVGYHAWADSSTVALFVLGEPATLQVADTRTGRARLAARSIGRSIQKVPGRRAVSFVHHVAPGEAWVAELDIETGAISKLVRTLEGGDFHAWTQDGWLLMGQGSKLYAWNPRGGSPTGDPASAWTEIAELPLANITRLAVSPGGRWLAIVADDPER